MKNLKQVTFNNVVYNMIAKGFTVVFQGVASIILTRTLLPSDYGVAGFAMIFFNFLMQFNDLGVNSALVQRRHLDDKALYTGFVMRLGMATILYVIAFVFSGLSTHFFDNEGVVNVIRVLSLNFLVHSFAFLPSSLIRRELDYKKVSISAICHTITNSTLSVGLALNGFGYWSIVIAGVAANSVMVFCLNVLKPVKVKFLFDKKIAREFFNFGGSLTLYGLFVFGMFNFDNFVIGTVKGSNMLGYYMVAFNWGSIICSLIGTIIGTILFPTFSKMQDDKDRIKRSYLRVIEYTSFLGILANLTLLLMSKDFLTHVLGHGTDKWLPALKCLRILCFYGMLRFFLEPVFSVTVALGKVNVQLKAGLLATVIELMLVYPALKLFGLEGVALVVTFSYATQYFIYFPFLRKEINMGFREVFVAVRPAIISGVIVSIIVSALQYSYMKTSMTSLIVTMVVCTALFGVAYGILTKWSIAREVKSLVMNIRAS